jgi:hypothetical protein
MITFSDAGSTTPLAKVKRETVDQKFSGRELLGDCADR